MTSQGPTRPFQLMNSLRPKALYGCKDMTCAEQHSYPANMIYWCDGVDYESNGYESSSSDDHPEQQWLDTGRITPGWYCENCIDSWLKIPLELNGRVGVSLAAFEVT